MFFGFVGRSLQMEDFIWGILGVKQCYYKLLYSNASDAVMIMVGRIFCKLV